MPVTVVLEHHKPKAHPTIKHSVSLDNFLQRSCPFEYSAGNDSAAETRILASSLSIGLPPQEKLYPSTSSFVRSVIEAWARQSHLVIRPDDIWFQILVQLNFFMTKNGESASDLFVAHKGKQDIEVLENTFKGTILRFRDELQLRVKTPGSTEWISPGLSTSEPEDDLSAIVFMMDVMSTFFEYFCAIICGILSITLLGTKADWERLLSKIDRLGEFGEEVVEYQHRLRPLLTRMVRTIER